MEAADVTTLSTSGSTSHSWTYSVGTSTNVTPSGTSQETVFTWKNASGTTVASVKVKSNYQSDNTIDVQYLNSSGSPSMSPSTAPTNIGTSASTITATKNGVTASIVVRTYVMTGWTFKGG